MPGDFIEAYEEHVWDVYAYLAYRLGSRADAEDLTQLTFERALRNWNRFDERKASMKTWILAIARNALIDHTRRAGTRQHASLDEEVADRDLPAAPNPEETHLGVSPELEVALGELTQRERELIGLRFGADLRGPEIAELVGLTLANVQQILSRGLRKLREQLERDESLQGGAGQ